MANIIATQVLLTGSRNKQIKITITSDGSGELVKQIIYNSSDYENDTMNNKLMGVKYHFNGFGGVLFWDATTDVPLMNLLGNHPDNMNFYYDLSGYPNNSSTGRTGDILLSTSGLATVPSGTAGEIFLYVKTKKATV